MNKIYLSLKKSAQEAGAKISFRFLRGIPKLIQLLALMAVSFAIVACSPIPTPYQPRTEDYGYEETRLQKNVYRISFKANRYTKETDILDYLYFRSAELTRDAAYSHFVVVQDFGKSQVERAPRSGFSVGMGFSSGTRSSLYGAGFSAPLWGAEERYNISYHLGVFIIRMLTPVEAENEKDAIEINYLIESVEKKITKPTNFE